MLNGEIAGLSFVIETGHDTQVPTALDDEKASHANFPKAIGSNACYLSTGEGF